MRAGGKLGARVVLSGAILSLGLPGVACSDGSGAGALGAGEKGGAGGTGDGGAAEEAGVSGGEAGFVSLIPPIEWIGPLAGAGNPETVPSNGIPQNVSRSGHTATLLGDGRVLLAGGARVSAADELGRSAELFEPDSAAFTLTGAMVERRVGHTATLLENGTVLLVGGAENAPSSTEIYDPATGVFFQGASTLVPRSGHAASLLGDGRVLVTGGTGDAGEVETSAEIYDAELEAFVATGSMLEGRSGHTATLLHDGRVLVVGGGSATAELYDPLTETFGATGEMAVPRGESTATLLQDGTVLVAGFDLGVTPRAAVREGPWAERYDPVSGSFASAGTMGVLLLTHTATLLGDGRVLIVGGLEYIGGEFIALPRNIASVYDPESSTFDANEQGETEVRREGGSTATLLPSGAVLVAGWNPAELVSVP